MYGRIMLGISRVVDCFEQRDSRGLVRIKEVLVCYQTRCSLQKEHFLEDLWPQQWTLMISSCLRYTYYCFPMGAVLAIRCCDCVMGDARIQLDSIRQDRYSPAPFFYHVSNALISDENIDCSVPPLHSIHPDSGYPR